jgi:integrase
VSIIKDALGHMHADGYAYNTIYAAHSIARKIFRQAIACDVIKNSPSDLAILPKVKLTVEDIEKDQMAEKYLEKEELKTFFRVISEKGRPMDEIIFVTLAYTGMRVGEL